MNSKLPSHGICALCGESADLQISHAIPDALFRNLFRKGSGSAIVLDSDPDAEIRTSQESWSARLLCKNCEGQLNTRYDAYGDMFCKGLAGSVSSEPGGLIINGIDKSRLRMFFLSIVWRMSRLQCSAYRGIKLHPLVDLSIRDCLQKNVDLPQTEASVRIFRLREPRGFDGFSPEHLNSFIAWPWQKSLHPRHSAVEFIYSGFIISVLFPGVLWARRRSPGVIAGEGEVFSIPYKDPLEIPEIQEVLMHTMQKHDAGKMTKAVKNKISVF